MTLVTTICALVAAVCLIAIQIRHMGKWTLFGSLLHKEVRQALWHSLDATDRRLALVSLCALILTLVFVASGYIQ